MSRFETVPNVLELDHLTVSGNVTFGRNVTLKVGGLLFALQRARVCVRARASVLCGVYVAELDHPGVPLCTPLRSQGTVIIIANEGERIEIPPCSLLENKIVTGNLRILDH